MGWSCWLHEVIALLVFLIKVDFSLKISGILIYIYTVHFLVDDTLRVNPNDKTRFTWFSLRYLNPLAAMTTTVTAVTVKLNSKYILK